MKNKTLLLALLVPALLFGQSKWTKNFNSLGHAYVNSAIENASTSADISTVDSAAVKFWMVTGGDEWNISMYNALGVLTFNVDSVGTGYFLTSVLTDKVQANTSAGLSLFEDGGTGLFVENGGQVGINDITPTYGLDVNGTFRVTGNGVFDAMAGVGLVTPVLNLHVRGDVGLPASSGTAPTGVMRLGSAAGVGVIDFGGDFASTGKGWIQVYNKTNLATNYALLLNPNGGNVGINETSPDSTLEVNGSGHFTESLLVDEYVNSKIQVAQFHRNVDLASAGTDTWYDVAWDTLIAVESTKGFTFNADSTGFITSVDGIVRVQGCGHWEWSGGNTDAKLYIRVLVNTDEARCLQSNDDRAFKSADDGMLSFIGTVFVNSGDEISIQYRVNNGNLDWGGSVVFDDPAAFSVNFEKISN